MNIFKTVLNQIAEGAKWNINLMTRSLRVYGIFIIKNGEYEGELGNEALEFASKEYIISELNSLYAKYKNSIPSERTNSRRKTYFKALKEHELYDDDMLYGEPREISQFVLEFTLLTLVISGVFDKHWDEWNMGNWFWQSEEDKDFVILKNWVVK